MTIINHTPQIYYPTFAQHTPALTIKPGQTIRTYTPDCDGYGPDNQNLDKNKFHQTPNSPLAIANPNAGPFIIEDAQPGDTLAIHLHNIEIDRDFGRTGLSAKQLTIPTKYFITPDDANFDVDVPKQLINWQIDHQNKTATLPLKNSKKSAAQIPLKPMVGCIGVAPPYNQSIATLYCGNFGGNTDIPDTNPDSTTYLPVFTRGAYLFLGDIHAAQGDGELVGGAIEVSGYITFSVELIKNKTIAYPRLETPTKIAAIGTAANIQQALEIAYAQLTLYLAQDYGYDRWEAAHLISQIAQNRPGYFLQSAFCSIPKSVI